MGLIVSGVLLAIEVLLNVLVLLWVASSQSHRVSVADLGFLLLLLKIHMICTLHLLISILKILLILSLHTLLMAEIIYIDITISSLLPTNNKMRKARPFKPAPKNASANRIRSVNDTSTPWVCNEEELMFH